MQTQGFKILTPEKCICKVKIEYGIATPLPKLKKISYGFLWQRQGDWSALGNIPEGYARSSHSKGGQNLLIFPSKPIEQLMTLPHLKVIVAVVDQSLSHVKLSHATLCNPMDYSTPGFPVLHYPPGVCSNSCCLDFLRTFKMFLSSIVQHDLYRV